MDKKLRIMVFLIASILIAQTAYASSVAITNLGTLPGRVGSTAHCINDNGQIVGESASAYDNFQLGLAHAFLWKNGVMTDLGTLPGGSNSYIGSYADGINNAGQIVGYSLTASGDTHAFLWKNGVMSDLGTLGGSESYANGINNAGQIVGSSFNASESEHAFLWQNGVMTDIGSLSKGSYKYASDSAYGINNAGQIVG